MKGSIFIWLILISLLVSSCFKEDEQIIPIPIVQVEIPYSMYEYQTYYSITNQSIVSSNSYSDWDLGFESAKDGFHIILNTARYMYAGNTYKTDFYSVTTKTAASEMLFDNSNGDLDSTVFIDWADYSDVNNPVFSQYVYIIDRGKDEQGEEFGFKKIVFEKLENDTFYIHFANLDNTEEFYYQIPKDTNTSFTQFSLDNGGQLKVSEPDKTQWDLCFTKYSTIIPDDNGVPTDYLVRGVFTNPYKNIEVALDTVNYFYDITSEMIDSYSYSKDRDAIGYDWKVFSDNVYTVRDIHSYILKNVDGINYKLRFTSFYNDLGEKGFPAFEIFKL